jgi:hypothetical protein
LSEVITKLGRSPSPATVGRGVFLKPYRRSNSLAVGSPIPPPPAAAPAARGWGIVDRRLIHSVGFSRWPAGGAEKEVVWSAWRFAAELILFDGGALRSSAVELSSSWSLRIRGSVELLKPSPALVWRLGRFVLDMEKEMERSLAMEMEGRGVSSLELASGDFPAMEGLYLIQAIERYGGGAPPSASSSTSGSSALICNFYLFKLDLYVRMGL